MSTAEGQHMTDDPALASAAVAAAGDAIITTDGLGMSPAANRPVRLSVVHQLFVG
jgi:hypothetical protein